MVFFETDARYRRFLAAHPGVWGEVGATEDPRFVSLLLKERRALGLPPLAVVVAAPCRRAARKARR